VSYHFSLFKRELQIVVACVDPYQAIRYYLYIEV